MPIEAVFFDVGETIVNETQQWSALADATGLSHLTFFAALGAVIERREDHRRVWDLVGIPRTTEWPTFTESDLYPDALPCLRRLTADGYIVGLAGNQPEHIEACLKNLDAPIDIVASSQRWGVLKPSPEFFGRIVEATGLAPDRIAYVGDRLDNDVLPAKQVGMLTIFIRRGPWGFIQATWPEAAQADACIHSLDEVHDVVARA